MSSSEFACKWRYSSCEKLGKKSEKLQIFSSVLIHHRLQMCKNVFCILFKAMYVLLEVAQKSGIAEVSAANYVAV